MPISFGFHAAFRWLLPHGESRRDHELRFESWESAPIRRLTGGLIDVTASKGNLRKAVLYKGSIILCIDLQTCRASDCGKPGADFLCIEQWAHSCSPRSSNRPRWRVDSSQRKRQIATEICLWGTN
jgi:hypothetical protein